MIRREQSANIVKNRLIALIRGINVGRAKRVAMADLRVLVESLGYGDVRTLLNSGNVVFSAPGTFVNEAAARIEEGLCARLGVTARVTVISAADLAGIVENNPLGEIAVDPSRLLVAVLRNPDDRAKLAPLARQDWTPEALAIAGRAAYLWCPNGILASRLPEALNRTLRDGVTARNWTTMTKLYAIADG